MVYNWHAEKEGLSVDGQPLACQYGHVKQVNKFEHVWGSQCDLWLTNDIVDHASPVNRQTDMTENIVFLQTMYAAGKNVIRFLDKSGTSYTSVSYGGPVKLMLRTIQQELQQIAQFHKWKPPCEQTERHIDWQTNTTENITFRHNSFAGDNNSAFHIYFTHANNYSCTHGGIRYAFWLSPCSGEHSN